jgi:hypothetical protein
MTEDRACESHGEDVPVALSLFGGFYPMAETQRSEGEFDAPPTRHRAPSPQNAMNGKKRQVPRNKKQGYLVLLQRPEQKLNSPKRLSLQSAHLLPGVGDAAKIEESQNKGIENGENMGCCALANLTGVLC